MINKKEAQDLCKYILKSRTLTKMKSTYYERMLNNSEIDGNYHGYFNHCSTITGRLTSDLQQVPKKTVSKVKQIFVSRFK